MECKVITEMHLSSFVLLICVKIHSWLTNHTKYDMNPDNYTLFSFCYQGYLDTEKTVETYQKNLKSLKGFAEGLMKNLETLDAMVSFYILNW